MGHLVRRLVGALSRRAPSVDDVAWVDTWLRDGERQVWDGMPVHDRRHSVHVARRYVEMCESDAVRDEVAAALLHDVGKAASSLGIAGRVVATIVGPRGRRFSAYHDHERIGAGICREAGSSALTCAMIDGSADAGLADRLRRADEI